MVRLWHRVGVFRILSAAVLVLGVVAAAQVSAERQAQQRLQRAAQLAQVAQDEQRELEAERSRVSAVSRATQREAQEKADAAASAAADQAKAAQDAARRKGLVKTSPSASASPSTSPSKAAPFGPIPASCSEYTGNVAIGCALMLDAGFGLDQMPCLKNLWMKESGWRETAGNVSRAYGIPQSNPGSKMSVYGADWKTNPATQIKWGLNYIKTKYRTPCGAWSNFQSKGYY
ncbi:lytic transglycosylase domain-containing protein [Planosporangium sp. 12N6]|uniref:aggregation-promoting factor C-terminal-like domain-containing protein n=1 Tax=Planosporangium spinosum TaxID=3402278 RepID=UPI003CE976CD